MHNLSKIPIRILVNGTRGKTSAARILAAAMNGKGIRTLCRTTGSEAQLIYPDGHVEPFVRRKRASILEYKKVFRLASEENVEAVVVECMALGEENQRLVRDHLVKPTHVVITNSLVDHVVEMGPTVEDTVAVLSQSVPKASKLYVTEDYYDGISSNVKKCVPYSLFVENPPIPLHPSTLGLVREVLIDLGFGEEAILSGLTGIEPDVGLLSDLPVGSSVLVPTFSVNDLETMVSTVVEKHSLYCGKRLLLVFNSRSDREYRVPLMKEVLGKVSSLVEGTYVIGDYPKKVARYLGGEKASVWASTPEELWARLKEEDDLVLVGLGNIKGGGEKLIALSREA